ncbi:MAG: DNA-processing protein DprA [Phycisphaerales bacterium JB052]
MSERCTNPAPGSCSERGRSLLALTLVPGLGPVRIARLIESFGSIDAVLGASISRIARVPGIGEKTAASIAQHLHKSIDGVDRELDRIAACSAHVVALGDPHYPPMLASIPAAPPVLSVRGRLDIEHRHKYTCAMVGSRDCSVYGVEQAGRFAGALGSAGICVVSGGARGIDTAAHRGAINAGGTTIVVLGCGIAHDYPPENGTLFNETIDRGGAVISELPTDTKPDAKNFPARNRIISGLSLGVLVIEAGARSGALITARHAVEDHGREVMALPGRVDSPSSAGSLDLLRQGAHLVVEPSDVLSILRQDARHLFEGTHTARTSDPAREPTRAVLPEPDGLPGEILRTLDQPRTGDELAERLGSDPGTLRSELTMLEIQGLVRREGSRFVRVR